MDQASFSLNCTIVFCGMTQFYFSICFFLQYYFLSLCWFCAEYYFILLQRTELKLGMQIPLL